MLYYRKNQYELASPSQTYESLVLRNINLPQHPIILDMASGNGNEIASLQQLFDPKKIVSLDVSINASNQRNFNNFVVGSSELIPFSDATFDFIHCKDGFVHFFKPQDFFSESHRVLKRGGKLLLVTETLPNDGEHQICQKYFIASEVLTHRIRQTFVKIDSEDEYRRSSVAYEKRGFIVSSPLIIFPENEIVRMAKEKDLQVVEIPPKNWIPAQTEVNWHDKMRQIFLFTKK